LHAHILPLGEAQMAQRDRLLETIEALQAAGLDEALWPTALGSLTTLFGAVGASFEVVYKPTRELRDFWSFGLPQACEMGYADHFMSVSPRVTYGLRQAAGEIGYDYMMLDEEQMRRDPFYSEFIPQFDLRYFVSVTLNPSARELAALAVQRSSRQGHVDNAEIALMRRLTPHLQLAFETTMRLRGASEQVNTLKDALGWLTDGVVLLRADGTITYANRTMEEISRRNDGIRIVKNRIEFRSANARGHFEAALGGIARLRADIASVPDMTDFLVMRRSSSPPYVVSLRPLPRRAREKGLRTQAVAVAFVRDPLIHDAAAYWLQREALGLTPAEAGLALALQQGIPLANYARRSALSLNTVYTHLRRIKEKTGCRRMPALIRKLNDLQVPLRFDETRCVRASASRSSPDARASLPPSPPAK
jgi:DNA-binding CsgD family transcriptional regulator